MYSHKSYRRGRNPHRFVKIRDYALRHVTISVSVEHAYVELSVNFHLTTEATNIGLSLAALAQHEQEESAIRLPQNS